MSSPREFEGADEAGRRVRGESIERLLSVVGLWLISSEASRNVQARVSAAYDLAVSGLRDGLAESDVAWRAYDRIRDRMRPLNDPGPRPGEDNKEAYGRWIERAAALQGGYSRRTMVMVEALLSEGRCEGRDVKSLFATLEAVEPDPVKNRLIPFILFGSKRNPYISDTEEARISIALADSRINEAIGHSVALVGILDEKGLPVKLKSRPNSITNGARADNIIIYTRYDTLPDVEKAVLGYLGGEPGLGSETDLPLGVNIRSPVHGVMVAAERKPEYVGLANGIFDVESSPLDGRRFAEPTPAIMLAAAITKEARESVRGE